MPIPQVPQQLMNILKPYQKAITSFQPPKNPTTQKEISTVQADKVVKTLNVAPKTIVHTPIAQLKLSDIPDGSVIYGTVGPGGHLEYRTPNNVLGVCNYSTLRPPDWVGED